MKTKIRKFLWFDITPRKELYKEINECYEEINSKQKLLIEYDRNITDLQEEIIILHNKIDDFTGEFGSN